LKEWFNQFARDLERMREELIGSLEGFSKEFAAENATTTVTATHYASELEKSSSFYHESTRLPRQFYVEPSDPDIRPYQFRIPLKTWKVSSRTQNPTHLVFIWARLVIAHPEGYDIIETKTFLSEHSQVK